MDSGFTLGNTIRKRMGFPPLASLSFLFYPSFTSFRTVTFQPVPILNMLAAAWVQFMIHDWLSHGKNQKENPWEIPLNDNDPWPEHPMRILRTHSDPTRTPGSD